MSRVAVSIVMPAFNAQATIARAVASALAQTWPHFEVIVVSDDGVDYEAVLGRAGVADPRIRHLQSGHIGGGSPPARNVGLEAARYDIAAILDADDAFKPEKLASMVPLAARHGLASCALDVTLPDGTHLRHVGRAANGLLAPGAYKFTNFSMDSMLVHDRRRADPRSDPSLPCMTDLDFLLKIFATVPACYHFGTPLHDYVKLPVSVSNGPGVTERMVATKTLLRRRLADGHYPLADPSGNAGIDRFLAISLAAERSFSPRPGANPPDLFEDHLEPRLAGG
jgi:glycosyltransferase involved in cell wall biosynthesis